MSSDVQVVTVGAGVPAPTVVSAGPAAGAPTVIGSVPPAVDLSGARVVSYADTGGPVYGQAAVPLTDAPVITTNAALGRLFEVTLHGNRTLADPTNLVADQRITWRLVQDSTGGRTLGLGAIFNINMVATGPIVLSTAPGAVDYLGGIYRAGTHQIDVLAFSPGF